LNALSSLSPVVPCTESKVYFGFIFQTDFKVDRIVGYKEIIGDCEPVYEFIVDVPKRLLVKDGYP
jgi:hypothetical protein